MWYSSDDSDDSRSTRSETLGSSDTLSYHSSDYASISTVHSSSPPVSSPATPVQEDSPGEEDIDIQNYPEWYQSPAFHTFSQMMAEDFPEMHFGSYRILPWELLSIHPPTNPVPTLGNEIPAPPPLQLPYPDHHYTMDQEVPRKENCESPDPSENPANLEPVLYRLATYREGEARPLDARITQHEDTAISSSGEDEQIVPQQQGPEKQ